MTKKTLLNRIPENSDWRFLRLRHFVPSTHKLGFGGATGTIQDLGDGIQPKCIKYESEDTALVGYNI